MKCTVCGKEISEGSAFCIYCGSKVEEMDWEQQEKMYRYQLENRKKECQKLEEKKEEKQKEEEGLKLKLSNYYKLQTGAYPGCYRWKSEPATTGKKKVQEKDKQQAGYDLLFLGLSILSCITVCFSWLNIPVIKMLFEYVDVSYSFNIFNILGILPDVGEMMMESSGSYWDSGSEAFGGIFLILLVTIILMGILILFHGCYIYRFMVQEPERKLKEDLHGAAICGLVCTGGMVILCLIADAWIRADFGDYREYIPSMIKIGTGVWILLFTSIAILVCMRIKENTKTCEGVQEKSAVLEITNYDPVLPFRPVRIEIKQAYSFSANLKVVNFSQLPVNMIVGELHIWKENGEKIVFPEMKFQKFIKTQGRETELTGQFYENQIEDEFVSLCEAKLYIKSYRVSSNEEMGSGYSVDSDYPPMALRNLRRQYGDGNIREEGLYGENRLCACGQIYRKETKKCPLCGKINQEAGR